MADEKSDKNIMAVEKKQSAGAAGEPFIIHMFACYNLLEYIEYIDFLK